jgi:hypothetical protein
MSNTDPPPKTKNDEQYGSPPKAKNNEQHGSLSTSFFILGGGSVLLILFCFVREFRVAHRFFVLGGGFVLLIIFFL